MCSLYCTCTASKQVLKGRPYLMKLRLKLGLGGTHFSTVLLANWRHLASEDEKVRYDLTAVFMQVVAFLIYVLCFLSIELK